MSLVSFMNFIQSWNFDNRVKQEQNFNLILYLDLFNGYYEKNKIHIPKRLVQGLKINSSNYMPLNTKSLFLM